VELVYEVIVVMRMDQYLKDATCRAPATSTQIENIENRLGKKLPTSYTEFLRRTNGAEGFIGKNAYVMLWGIDDLLSKNEAYKVNEYAPGLLIFGSDGGGEAYGFDTRMPQWSIVQVPFVGMEWKVARFLAASFDAFLGALYRS